MNQMILLIAVCACFCVSAQAENKLPAKAKPKVVATKLPVKAVVKNGVKTAGRNSKANVASVPATGGSNGIVTSSPARGLASVSDSNSALEVRGQSRNLSMMLTLRNRKNEINFVKPRESYSTEIQNTSY